MYLTRFAYPPSSFYFFIIRTLIMHIFRTQDRNIPRESLALLIYKKNDQHFDLTKRDNISGELYEMETCTFFIRSSSLH